MPRRHILIVDDNPDTLAALRELLEQHDYEVDTANNGVTALRKAREDKPDLIILDIFMPVLNGYEVCTRIRNDRSTARIPILMFTRRGSIEGLEGDEMTLIAKRFNQIWEGYEVGATDYLAKPITPQKMLAAVKAIFWAGGARYRRSGSSRQAG
jgi:DNA-binding response OmpR family regulator